MDLNSMLIFKNNFDKQIIFSLFINEFVNTQVTGVKYGQRKKFNEVIKILPEISLKWF